MRKGPDFLLIFVAFGSLQQLCSGNSAVFDLIVSVVLPWMQVSAPQVRPACLNYPRRPQFGFYYQNNSFMAKNTEDMLVSGIQAGEIPKMLNFKAFK